MKRRAELVVIGGSAGSLHVLLGILPQLPHDLSLPVIIVLHRKPVSQSSLQKVLQVKTPVPVVEAEEKEKIKPGVIYVAPADYHLLVEPDRTFSLDFSEKVNYSRPSIDVTLETAAHAYRQNTAAILLSGANADGVKGLKMIKQYGGTIAAQDPATAIAPYMPQKAILNAKVDHVLQPEEIAGFIATLM
jgi:two-component system chemotaxis response regulator CheB